MVKAYKIIIIIVTVMISSSCCEYFNNGYPCVDVENLKGFGEYQDISKLRTDGYYYYKENDGSISCYIFFMNGINYGSGYEIFTNQIDEFEQIENQIKELPYFSFGWGSFEIKSNFIFRYSYNTVIMWKRNIFVREIEILNDTTIKMNKDYKNLNTGEITSYDGRYKIFHFRKLEHKPDSTNFLMRDEYLQDKMKKGYEEYLKGKK